MIATNHCHAENDNKKGCVGCHEGVKKNRECAGCHGVMERVKFSSNCLKCHMEAPESRDSRAPDREIPAAMHHASQKPVFEEISDEDIPERVIIDKLSSRYGAVDLPHRRIIDSMLLDINKSKLASRFHNGKETVCLGCHHNSPKGKILSCDNCHNRSSDGQDFSMPALNVALSSAMYGCHDRMDIELPGSKDVLIVPRLMKAKTK
jgi:hypothetical protein